ncbi:uncharacterized protein LOC107326135 [Python bivittatus]|uniref:Uncharacterized protein LOC107326135 n=1 Tax=Python bivittatus TaxID=176946 RepID=A0A9F3VZA2_PYTBI|nr:uncharacterized protein LOC107326135 [Python bivittatus]
MLMDQSRHPNPNTTCLHPSLCYDRLIKQCLSCKRMQRVSRKETTTMLGMTSITTQPVQLHPGNQNCSALIFGFCAFVGLVTIMAMLWLVILKQRKRMRKTGKENSKENGNCTSFLANKAHTSHDYRPGDYDPGQLRCSHLNGVTKTTQDNVLKENIPCIVFTRSQEFEVIPMCPHDAKCNSPFPLPATELGATMLVTTKTTQENILSEELP